MSVPYVSPLEGVTPPESVELTVFTRSVDFAVSKQRNVMQIVTDAARTFLAARTSDATIVCTAMAEAVTLAVLYRLAPRRTLAVWDFLLPTSPRMRRLARWALRRVDHWFVIRTGDADILARHVGAAKASFIPFPVQALPSELLGSPPTSGVVYAGGSAHRDWATLVEASRLAKVPTLISTNAVVPVRPDDAFVRIIPLTSPSEGRRHLADAVAVCVPLEDTDLPCGPLVILDALAAGKPVVTTAVNGSRDYVEDGVTALVVPPRDATAMAAALVAVTEDVDLRRRLGEAGRAFAVDLTPERVLAELVDALASASADPAVTR